MGMDTPLRLGLGLSLIIGLGWGAVWGWLVPWTPLASLDWLGRDLLAQLWPRPIPEQIVLLGIDGRMGKSERTGPDFYPERASYAALLERLLGEAKAKVVLLSLPNGFVLPQRVEGDDLDQPLRKVIDRYNTRVVIESVPANGQIEVFNHLLTLRDDLEYKVSPEVLVGVRQFLADPDGTVRHTRTEVILRRRDSGAAERFFSSDYLAVRKFLGRSVPPIYEQDRIHFFGPEQTFTEYGIEEVCPPDPLEGCGNLKDRSILKRFTGKIVLVGIVDGYQDTPEESTPSGKMDALDLHANIIAGLLSGTVDRQLPLWIDGLVTVLVGLAGGWALSTRRAAWASGGVILLYAALLLALSVPHSSLMLPVIPPLAAFACTALTLGGLAFTRQTRSRLKAQEEELNRLRRAEREAILNQVKKLLYRVATDIHDRPLQELKLVMDQLEQLLFELPEQASKAQVGKRLDQALVSLQNVGRGIRVELNDLRQVAAKLEITPALKNGLHAGLHSELDRLVESGELHLNIERAIKPLIEPSADSQWLDEREDLFRFFKEALNNAIRHGQARGATKLRVELAQTGALACLVVENDGPAQLPASEQSATVLTPEGSPDDPARGGYGTKVMNTIASELLAGKWERVFMPDGGARVVLLWQMSTGSPAS